MSQTTYHGDSSREHRFWVYPKGESLIDARWDAFEPNHLCDNFTLLDGNSDSSLRTYKCNGHQSEWHCGGGCTNHSLHENCNVSVTSGVIALRSNANGKYVCADGGGSKPLVANRDGSGGWESFDLVVIKGDKVALKSRANGKYVSAENEGKDPLVANRTEVGPCETFRIMNRGIGKVALMAVNGKYVCAEKNANGELIANRSKVASWETFDLVWK